MQLLIVDIAPPDLHDLLTFLRQRQLLPATVHGGSSVEAWLVQQGLTPREGQIVCLDLQGYSRAEIAAKLGLSPLTISSYWREIYDKLGIHSRSEIRRTIQQTMAGSSASTDR